MTEPDYLRSIRMNYDTVAASYAELVPDRLGVVPWDRMMLATFAEVVQASSATESATGPVADIGCGPGHVTAHLHKLGLSAFGIDLSPEMIARARRAYPDLRFDVGSMTSLDLADESVAGVVAWYSIIHTPPQLLPGVFAEFHRVLAPGGYLMVAFKVGDESYHLQQGYGHDMSLEVYRLPPDQVAQWSHDAGLPEVLRLVRQPEAGDKQPQGFFVARKPR